FSRVNGGGPLTVSAAPAPPEPDQTAVRERSGGHRLRYLLIHADTGGTPNCRKTPRRPDGTSSDHNDRDPTRRSRQPPQEDTVRIKSTPSPTRTARLLALTVGVVAVGAFALPAAASAAPQQYSVFQLAAVSDAVQRSGVDGIAWYV